MLRRSILFVLLAMATTAPATAADWARPMFTVFTHDFGTVARDAEVVFEYPIKNIYDEDVHIASVRSSCGCTQVSIKNPWLKTYEEGAIVARINTASFRGNRGATLTVTFDKPYRALVQIHTKVHIRGDVVFRPGSVRFGSIDQGTAVEKTVSVDYLGRGTWNVLDVISSNPHVSAEILDTTRRGSRVTCDLKVRLDENAPAGYLRDHLQLVTSDRQRSQIPLAVDGFVDPGLTVSPSSLFLGIVEPGEKATKHLIVRGARPFRILSITSSDASFDFGTYTSAEPKLVHTVPVTFTAGEASGKVLNTIRIETDLGKTIPELSAYAVIPE